MPLPSSATTFSPAFVNQGIKCTHQDRLKPRATRTHRLWHKLPRPFHGTMLDTSQDITSQLRNYFQREKLFVRRNKRKVITSYLARDIDASQQAFCVGAPLLT